MYLILILFFSICIIYSFLQLSRFKILPWILCGLSFLAIYFVLFPDSTTLIANNLGVGRGADLILYLWVLISTTFAFILSLKIRSNHYELTSLARTIAIINVSKN